MKLKLPTVKDLKSTFSMWAAEIRKINFLVEDPWRPWTPSYSAANAMTYTNVTTVFAKYIQIGKVVFFAIRAVGTTGGVASPYIYVTLPVEAKMIDQERFVSSIVQAGAGAFSLADIQGDQFLRFSIDAIGNNWGLGADRYVITNGFYEAR